MCYVIISVKFNEVDMIFLRDSLAIVAIVCGFICLIRTGWTIGDFHESAGDRPLAALALLVAMILISGMAVNWGLQTLHILPLPIR
jgi:hypothetical protein